MKSPNESNIDEWLFHYFEGDLTPEEENVIEEFLLDHPQYDAHFEAWGASRIQHEAIVYPQQELLAKPLIPFGVLHKVAVFSAIAVNAVLAGFIIFGNREQAAQYNAVQLETIFAKGAYTDGNNSTNYQHAISSDFHPNDGQNDGSDFALNTRSKQIKDSAIQQNRKFNKTAVSNELTLRARLTDDNEASIVHPMHHITQTPDVDTDFSYDKYLNSSGIENLDIAQVLDETNVAASNHLQEYKVDQTSLIYAEPSTLASSSVPSSTNKSVASKSPKISDSKDKDAREQSLKDSKSPIKPIRFRGGDALLTNTRSQEYLIPGGNRNTINFAHVGSDFASSAYWNAYSQWPGKSTQLLVNQLGYDLFIPQIKSGVGIQMMYSTYGNGTVRDFETALTYSPKFILSKNFVLEPAMRLRMSTTGVNRGKLSPGSWMEFDRGNAFQYSQEQHDAFVNRSIQQDLGFGLLLNSKWGFMGVNADHILGNVNQALHFGGIDEMSRAPMFVNAVLGTEYESLNKKLLWSGQLIYQNHGQLNKIWLGSRIKYNYLSLGASVSSMGEPMFSAGIVSKGISLLYSGDYSYSRWYDTKFLSHQLLLRITLKESRMKKLLLN